MKIYKHNFQLISAGLALLIFSLAPTAVSALEPGTILYRTSNKGQMYGYSTKDLLKEEYGIITHLYSGHAGLYIGQENGVDYVVEALGDGIVKTPAKYFVNENNGEKLVAAKLPKAASPWQRARAVAIAKYLASADLAYDFDFSAQKGPASGDWTCVGLTEKIYESANAANPERLGALEYNPSYYAVNITPDGYDRDSLYNDKGDCFSTRREFSRIVRREKIILPAPEKIGYDAGKEYAGQRYIFIPYTQALQTTLADAAVDIQLSSAFPEEAVRGKVNNLGLILRWSLINNPVSSVKKIASVFSKGWTELFGSKEATETLVWDTEGSPELNLDQVQTAADDQTALNQALAATINPTLNANNKTPAVSTKTAAVAGKTITDKELEENKNIAPEEDDDRTAADQDTAVSTLAADIFSSARPKVADSVAIAASVSARNDNQADAAVKAVDQTKTSEKTKVALWSPIVNKTASTSKTSSKSQASTTQQTKKEETKKEEAPLTLLLSRIYTAGDDDWLEIWNYGDEDIDLAKRKVRLEKSKTAADPGIILRFDVSTDASFPGGKVIRAGEGYRIVRNKAAADLQAAAQAIASRTDFNLADSGYTIYLASGPVSSQNDADIIDFVGYGQAKYFKGAAPAPAGQDGYLLRRKADADTKLEDILDGGEQANWPPIYNSGQNGRDWLLWPLGGELPEADEDEDNEGGNNNGGNNESGNNQATSTASNTPTTLLPGRDSPGLWRLWSFEGCAGSTTPDMISGDSNAALATTGTWSIGRWGCGQKLPYQPTVLTANLDPSLSGEAFTLAFQFKGNNDYAHPYFNLENQKEGVSLQLGLFNGMMELHNFPGMEGRYSSPKYMDDQWHHGVLVWNASAGYWGFYVDGSNVFFQNFSGLAPGFDQLVMGAVDGINIIDEVALWNRALSETEIKEFAAVPEPFNPQPEREAPAALSLKYAWNFDEATGQTAHDSINGLDWTLAEGASVYDGVSGRALSSLRSGQSYQLSIPDFKTNNFSASWWWQNTAPLPYSGRLRLDFKQDGNLLAGVDLEAARQRLIANGQDEIWAQGDSNALPIDNLWHHLALTYDDYNYQWRLFVDGALKLEAYRLPIPVDSEIDSISLNTLGEGYKVDNFKLWQGKLDAAIVSSEYEAEKQP